MTLSPLSESYLRQLVAIETAAHIAPWTEEVFMRCFAAGYCLRGIIEEKSLIGFVIFSLQAGECHILNVCVHPQFQHQGFGHHLMTEALTEAKTQGAGVVFLEVRRSNAHALALYKKMGFIQIGERKGYYPDYKGREDALVLAKDLGVE